MLKNKFKLLNNDEKAFLSLMDALLAIMLIFVVLAIFNTVIDIDINSLSEDSHDFKRSQDMMEIMAMDIDGKDYSILEKISYTLAKSNNSRTSQREVATFLSDYFDNYLDCHYSFVENNQLNGKEIVSNGDRFEVDNLTVATRNYGNYSYSLYIW